MVPWRQSVTQRRRKVPRSSRGASPGKHSPSRALGRDERDDERQRGSRVLVRGRPDASRADRAGRGRRGRGGGEGDLSQLRRVDGQGQRRAREDVRSVRDEVPRLGLRRAPRRRGAAPRRRAVSEGTRGRRARGRLPPPVTRAPTRRRARGVALPPTISSTGGVIGRRGGRSAFAMFHASNATSRSRARATARRGGVFRARSIAPGPALARPTSRAVPGTSARERVAPSPGPVTPPREEKYPQTHGSGFGSAGRIATRIRSSAAQVVRVFSSDSRPPRLAVSSADLTRPRPRPDETLTPPTIPPPRLPRSARRCARARTVPARATPRTRAARGRSNPR